MGLLNYTEKLVDRWSCNDKLKVQKTPLGVSGIILELLKDHLRYNSQQFHYIDGNPAESKVLIDLHQQWNPSNCENYPGVYVKRLSWAPRAEGRALGDYKNLLINDDGYSYEFWVPMTTSFNIICVGKQYGELERLLDEIATYLTVFNEPIRMSLSFHRFEVQQVSPVEILQEEKDYRYGQITLSLLFDFVWKLTLEKPLLNKMNIEYE